MYLVLSKNGCLACTWYCLKMGAWHVPGIAVVAVVPATFSLPGCSQTGAAASASHCSLACEGHCEGGLGLLLPPPPSLRCPSSPPLLLLLLLLLLHHHHRLQTVHRGAYCGHRNTPALQKRTIGAPSSADANMAPKMKICACCHHGDAGEEAMVRCTQTGFQKWRGVVLFTWDCCNGTQTGFQKWRGVVLFTWYCRGGGTRRRR
jgi:hypothetical protein